MSGPVDVCSFTNFLQLLISKSTGITKDGPLSRMVVCGPPDLTVNARFASNLIWVASDLSISEVCQPNRNLLKCEDNETLAMLLTSSCLNPLISLTTILSNVTTAPKATPPSTTNTTQQPNTTTQINNTSRGTVQPNITTQVTNLNTTLQSNFNLSSTAATLNTFNQTSDGSGSSLTTANATTSTVITTTGETNATHGPAPALTSNTTDSLMSFATGNTTTTTTPIQTTTLASNTTTETGTTQNNQEEQEQAAEELIQQTQSSARLNSSQVAQVVGQLEKLLEGPTVSRSVGQKAITIISNLMTADSSALSASANRMIQLVDSVGLKLDVTSESEILSSDSLVLAVRAVDGSNFPTTFVNIFNTDNIQLRGLRSQSRSSETAVGSVFLPSSLTEGLSDEEQRQASRVQFTFYTSTVLFQDAALDNQTIVSPVLGSSVANLSISSLRENIQFTIQNINPVPANYVASCVFWDFTQNGGGGGWNSTGCSVLNATQEDTTCSCDHLTSFAILLDLSREGIIDRQHALILTFITYIGCGISAVFLSVTLLTYLSFRKLLRDIPSKILVQLCFSLLFLNLVFMLDGWLALYPAPGLCISTAFFLHYFLLTSFTWAGLEALHMYLSIVRVFTPYLSRYMLKFSLLGWGLPLIVVIIIIAVDKDNYGLVTYGKYTNGTSDDFCWLRNNIAFYVGVVAYFLLIFALCLLVFIVVLVQLQRIKRQNPQNQSPNRGILTDLRSMAGLIVLLGLTWGFALFAWGPLYLPFVYLFSIFNSLQGLFIFVLHCAVKENVRKQWRTFLCCGKLRLAENSEWSRTATHSTKKQSVNMSNTSAFSPTSRSSSVISEGTSSSSSVFADSGISDGSNNDVVLNEIHRRQVAPQDVASNNVSIDL
ncbi:hypothetical protein LDENG_00034460 [Lucifuga dentata]|nr:hypothetical protein LDENG_00034460 [Lucifuga dentata]